MGTGPFVLDTANSQKGTRWVWKKNPDYWEPGKPYLDELRWLVLPSDATAHAGFQTKQIELLNNLSSQDFREVSQKNLQATAHKYLQVKGLHLWLSQARPGPLTDLRVRRAFSLALDRDEFNRTIAGGEGVWALPGAMAGLFTEAEAKQLLKQDLNEAKRLLAEAGHPNGIELDFPVTTDESQASMTWYQLAQAQVKRAGFNVTLKAQDKAAQRQKVYTGDGDLFANNSYGVLEADNDSILYGLYHSASSGNWSRIKDPDLDKLLEAQRREVDAEKRREAQRSAVRRIVDQMWIVELIYPPKWDLTQTYVKNYHPHFAVRGEGAFVWLDK